jgi:hypothetical protein
VQVEPQIRRLWIKPVDKVVINRTPVHDRRPSRHVTGPSHEQVKGERSGGQGLIFL